MFVSLELFTLKKLKSKESGMWKIATFDIFQVLFCTFHSSKNMAQTTRENAQGQNL